MINDILRDLIDIEDVATFINDILVGTEDKRRHNEIVEDILKKIKANDLYMKSKKCVWKVKEIDFLGLVMGAEGIKM